MNSKNLISLIFQLVVSGSVNFLYAQDNFQLKTFTTDNGLSHNFVQSIAQDQTGFLWIATWDGLSCYDGYEFKNYYHKPGDSTSFPFFCTDKVLADHLNNIWVFSQGRPAVMYDRAKDSFHPFYFTPEKNSRLNDIAIGPDNNVWLSIGKSLYQYNIETKKLRSYKIKGDTLDKLIYDKNGPQMVFDNTGGIWIYYTLDNEYHIFKGSVLKDSTLEVHLAGSIPLNKYKSNGLHNTSGNFDIYISESGKTWLFSRYGLFYLNTKQERFLENKDPVDPTEFKGKLYFVWTEDKTGIHIINTKNKSLITIKPDNENYIETVFIDKSGIIWSGEISPTRENIGLNRYLKTPEYFKYYLNGKNENNSINLVFPILKDKYNNIWAATRYLDYLFRIKPDGTQEKVYLAGHKNNQPPSKALSMVEDSGGIWIGTSNFQLMYYDFLTNNSSVRYPDKNNAELPPLTFHNLLLSNNSIIINANKGIFRFTPESNIIKKYYQHFPDGTGFSLIKDGRSGFWLGTQGNRVVHLDADLIKTDDFKLGPENNIVEHICVGDSNDIWVALMGGGLGHLYLKSGKTEIFTTADGLSNNVIYSILKDRKGNLWISTNQGISRFNPHTNFFRNFGKKEGLLISEFNSDSFFQASDGEMFFGGVGGMVSFYPDSVDNYKVNNTLSPLIITGFKVSGIPRYFKKAVYEMDTLILKKGDNNFQINFSCLDFQNPEMIRYRYRLLDENSDWIETDFRNSKINYAHLTHRNYKLEIESINESGELLNKASVLITIPHRLTEILWVRLSLVIVLLSGVSFIALNYLQQLKLRAGQVQDQLRLESLRGQMNPHFIFNSLNSINYFISKEDKLSANHYIADFSRLIRSILSNLSSDYVPFESELESLRDYLKLEYLRFGDKFNYSLFTDKIENPDEISVFPGLVQPFIENAIWHGVRGLEDRKGFIRIEFVQVSSVKIKCVIEDDGIGRKMALIYRNELPGHKSRGTGIVQERLKILNSITKHNYQVKIEDLYPAMEETGTRVTLDIPVRATVL